MKFLIQKRNYFQFLEVHTALSYPRAFLKIWSHTQEAIVRFVLKVQIGKHKSQNW